MVDSNQVGVQGVVNDEPASGGSPFRFCGSVEDGYLWLAWEYIHLTKAHWCRAVRRMGLGVLKRTLLLPSHGTSWTLAVLLSHDHSSWA